MTLTHNHAQLTATVAEHIATDTVIAGLDLLANGQPWPAVAAWAAARADADADARRHQRDLLLHLIREAQ